MSLFNNNNNNNNNNPIYKALRASLQRRWQQVSRGCSANNYEGRSKSFATWHDNVKMSMHYAWHVSVETTVFTYYNSVVVDVTSSLMMTSQRGKVNY